MPKNYVNSGTTFKDILKRIEEIDPNKQEKYRSRDDLTVSRLFSAVFKNKARFNVTEKEWFVYDGMRWKMDTGSMITESLAKTFIKALQTYAINKVDDQSYLKFLLKYGDRPSRKRVIEDARDFNYCETIDFDQDPYLFNCINCVIDLKTGKRMDHDPDLLLSKISNVVYDPDIVSDDFNRFIHEVMQNDEQKIEYIQKIFGYSLTGENTQEECYIFYGPTTRNGKSTLLDVVGHIMGDYGMNAQPETLAKKDRNSRAPSGDIARLLGCRFLQVSEPPKRMNFDAALLKNMTGRDKLTARHIFGRDFEFVPIFKLIMNTNYLPIVTDDTLFTSGRVKVITFDRHFEPEEQDPKLKSRLKTEHNVSGIFNWILEGLSKYIEAGEILIEPEAVVKATEDYRQKSDKIQNFIDECFVYTPGFHTTIKEAYDLYSRWCDSNGFGTENKGNFLDDIKTKGIYAESGTISGKTSRRIIKNYSIPNYVDVGPF